MSPMYPQHRQVPEIAGANKAAAFDGSHASMYLMAGWRVIG